MIRSISPRWASEKLCARAGAAAPIASPAAATMMRGLSEIIVISSINFGCLWPVHAVLPTHGCVNQHSSGQSLWLPLLGTPKGRPYAMITSFTGSFRPVGGDIVGLDPAGRAGRQARFGARGELARGLEVA